jgi:hypothetical protein
MHYIVYIFHRGEKRWIFSDMSFFVDCIKRLPFICDLFMDVLWRVTYDSLDCSNNSVCDKRKSHTWLRTTILSVTKQRDNNNSVSDKTNWQQQFCQRQNKETTTILSATKQRDNNNSAGDKTKRHTWLRTTIRSAALRYWSWCVTNILVFPFRNSQIHLQWTTKIFQITVCDYSTAKKRSSIQTKVLKIWNAVSWTTSCKLTYFWKRWLPTSVSTAPRGSSRR